MARKASGVPKEKPPIPRILAEHEPASVLRAVNPYAWSSFLCSALITARRREQRGNSTQRRKDAEAQKGAEERSGRRLIPSPLAFLRLCASAPLR
jgi:hypothetical protein